MCDMDNSTFPSLRVRDPAPSAWDRFRDPLPVGLRLTGVALAVCLAVRPDRVAVVVLLRRGALSVASLLPLALFVNFFLRRARPTLLRLARIVAVASWQLLRFTIGWADAVLARWPYRGLRRYVQLSGWAAFIVAVVFEASAAGITTFYVQRHRVWISVEIAAARGGILRALR